MQEHWELIDTQKRDGFTIELHFAPEYDWFCARVTASKDGIELGTDYLGGCCYSNTAEFTAPDGYYPDMVANAIELAKAQLARLCECQP